MSLPSDTALGRSVFGGVQASAMLNVNSPEALRAPGPIGPVHGHQVFCAPIFVLPT